MPRTFSVGYFAIAQYDVRSPIVGVADTSPEGGSKKSFRKLFPEGGSEFCFIVFASVAKQSPGRVEVYGVYYPHFFGGIAAVATLLRNDGKAIVRWDISLRSI